MPPITYSFSNKPGLRAAMGSFHVKSPTTYLTIVLMTVRVLPFFLTVVLICSVTLFVSILGVRSYSDANFGHEAFVGSFNRAHD